MIRLAALSLLWTLLLAPTPVRAEHVAIFAGGCFWCLEAEYQAVAGVIDAIPGYTGGHAPNPTFGEVSKGETGHYKAVRIVFDPDLIDYRRLVRIFWLNIDPAEPGGQFCDSGDSDRAAIFVLDAAQGSEAERSKAELEHLLRRPVPIPILQAHRFWPAEATLQNYAEQYPLRFQFYERACARKARLREIWGALPVFSIDD